MNIILTGGFSGGHIIPLIRLAKKMKEHQYLYLGFENHLEEKLAKESNIEFFGLKKFDTKFKRYFYVKKYFNEIEQRIKKFKPQLVISTGGYHSFPMIYYAKKNNIKYILIEENMKIGLLNMLFKKNAYKFITSFPLSLGEFGPNPSIYFNPVKQSIEYDFLCIGGSLGSHIIIKEAIKLSKKYKVLVIAGRYQAEYLKYQTKNFKVLGFVNLLDYYGISKLIITRSGSSTLFELIKANASFVTIPASKTKRNHQFYNAKFIEKNGLGLMLNENRITKKSLIKALNFDFTKIKETQKNFIESFEDNFYEEIIRGI